MLLLNKVTYLGNTSLGEKIAFNHFNTQYGNWTEGTPQIHLEQPNLIPAGVWNKKIFPALTFCQNTDFCRNSLFLDWIPYSLFWNSIMEIFCHLHCPFSGFALQCSPTSCSLPPRPFLLFICLCLVFLKYDFKIKQVPSYFLQKEKGKLTRSKLQIQCRFFLFF